MLAARRYPTIRNLTLPMKAFLITSSGTFVGIIAADHASRDFEAHRNAGRVWYENREERRRHEELASLSTKDRIFNWARQEKYKIIVASWMASMVGSFAMVGRNPFLSGQQKLVQARVYAQGLTLAVLCASAAFEISDQKKGKGILDSAKKGKEAAKNAKEEPNKDAGDPDLWKDMVAAEEHRLKQKHKALYEHHEAQAEKKEEEQEEGKKEENDGDKKPAQEANK